MKEASFIGSCIRRTTRGKRGYYSVIDIIAGITGSKNPRDYWYRVKKRGGRKNGVDLSTFCRRLRLPGPDGKYYFTDCVDRDGISTILKQLPTKVSGPLLRQKNYTLEDLRKHLLKKEKAEQNRPSPVSCRRKAETIGISDDLWLRLHRAVHPILKALYCTPEPEELHPGTKTKTQPSDPHKVIISAENRTDRHT